VVHCTEQGASISSAGKGNDFITSGSCTVANSYTEDWTAEGLVTKKPQNVLSNFIKIEIIFPISTRPSVKLLLIT